MKGGTLKISQIDSLSTVPRLLVWAGISLVAILVLALGQYLIGDSTFGWSWSVLFAIFMTAACYWGSESRNRKHSR